MRFLEREGRLNRAVEFLPDEEMLEERRIAKQGLTRPELSVMVSYAKLWLYDTLLASDLPDDPRLINDLVRYFPEPVREPYRAVIEEHRLKREIIATGITNSMVNRVGGTFMLRLMEETGLPPAEIARAYSLDYRVPAALQTAMMHQVNRLVERATLWFLRNGVRPLDIGAHVAEFQDGIATLTRNLSKALPGHYMKDLKARAQPLIDQGFPEDLAIRVSAQINLLSGLDIVRLAAARGLDVVSVSQLYSSVGGWFRLGKLRAAAEGLESDTHWQKLAVAALIEEVYSHQAALTAQVLDFAPKVKDPDKAIDKWVDANAETVTRAKAMLAELWTGEVDDLSMIAVASRQLRSLTAPGS